MIFIVVFFSSECKVSKHTTTIEATAINFSGDLKEKKFKDFKDTSIDKICKGMRKLQIIV